MFNFVKNEYDRQRCLAYLDMIVYHLNEETERKWGYTPESFNRVSFGVESQPHDIYWTQSRVWRAVKNSEPEEKWVDLFLREEKRKP